MTEYNVGKVAELDEILADGVKTVITFSDLAMCIPCKRLHPHMERVAQTLPEVNFVYIDIISADEDLLDKYGVSGVPYVLGVADGRTSTIESRTALTLIKEITAL